MAEKPRNRNRRELERASGNLNWFARHIFKVLAIFSLTAEIPQETLEQRPLLKQYLDAAREQERQDNDNDNDTEEGDDIAFDVSILLEVLEFIPERYHRYRDALYALLEMSKMLQDSTERLRSEL